MRKILIMLIVASLMAATIPVSNAELGGVKSDGIKPYKGLVGADSPFYGLKLLLQKFQIATEGNDTARLNKHLSIGQERLAEAYAAALNNDTRSMGAALKEYKNNMLAINSTLDNDDLSDLTYLNTSEELQDQEDVLSNMTNDTTFSAEVRDILEETLYTSETIKNGRPFFCNDTTGMAYFVPPGQMKKLASGGTTNMPGGLYKKGYNSPLPIVSINGDVIWPWEEGYDEKLLESDSVTSHGKKFKYASEDKRGKGNKKGTVQTAINTTVNTTST